MKTPHPSIAIIVFSLTLTGCVSTAERQAHQQLLRQKAEEQRQITLNQKNEALKLIESYREGLTTFKDMSEDVAQGKLQLVHLGWSTTVLYGQSQLVNKHIFADKAYVGIAREPLYELTFTSTSSKPESILSSKRRLDRGWASVNEEDNGVAPIDMR